MWLEYIAAAAAAAIWWLRTNSSLYSEERTLKCGKTVTSNISTKRERQLLFSYALVSRAFNGVNKHEKVKICYSY